MEQFYRFLVKNKILRITLVLFMVLVFTLVPFENRLEQAKHAYAVAIVDDGLVVILVVALLVAMGITTVNAYNAFGSSGNSSLGMDSLKSLARDIIANVPEVAVFAAYKVKQFGTSVASCVMSVPKAIKQAIRNYLNSKYGDDVEDGINKDNSLLAVPGTIVAGGMRAYPLEYAKQYSFYESVLWSYPFSTEFNPCDQKYVTTYYSEIVKSNFDTNGAWLSDDYAIRRTRTYDDGRTETSYTYDTLYRIKSMEDYVVLAYTGMDKNSCTVDGYFYYSNASGISYRRLFEGLKIAWVGDEYAQALQLIKGYNPVSVDKNIYTDDSHDRDFVKYYNDVLQYEQKTSADISTLKASVDGLRSDIINSQAKTLTWSGDITDCPIDDLKTDLEDVITGTVPVIGDWTCQWTDTNTVDISVTDMATGDVAITQTGEISTTWDDVTQKVGTDTISDATTDVGTGTGDLTVPDDKSKLDWKPLQLAGELFTTRFPFSLPWDLYRAFTAFKNGSDKAPVLKLPIDLGDFGDYSCELDLSVFDDNVVLVVRWSTYIGFVVLLIYVTNKLIGRG